MNNYRQIGAGSAYVLVEWRGERVWLARHSTEYDEYLEEGIRKFMSPSPRKLIAPKVNERRVTLQLSAQWKGKTRIVKHVELRETVTTEVFG